MKKILFSLLIFLVFPVAMFGQEDAVTQTILNLVNTSRNQTGTASLIYSDELHIAAQQHSFYMAETGQLNHVGQGGSQFWERMINSGYNLTSGAENILLRSNTDPQATFNQWWNSAPHRTNMMNATYVEVGIAYAQAQDGTYYFTMLLGTRNGVVAPLLPSPTLPPPTSTTIPPSITPLPPTSTPTTLPTATFTVTPLIPPTRTLSPFITPVQVTPYATFEPTIQPSATPELPPDVRLMYTTESLTLINISGEPLNLTEIAFRSDSGEMSIDVWDTEFLTQPLNNFTDGDCLQVWGMERNLLQDKVESCQTRHGWVAVNSGQLFWKNTISFFVLNEGNVIAQCFIDDGQCNISLEAELNVDKGIIVPIAENRDIRLIFNQDSMTLLNISGFPIDLRGIVFQNGSKRLYIEEWNTEFLSTSLGGFPSGDCLMVWTFSQDVQSTPLDCETRHGWIVVGEDADVWRNTVRFDVVRDNRILAGCVVANGYCDVSLQGNLGTDSPTVVPNVASVPATSNTGDLASTSSDLTMIYNVESFTVINTSGRSLDLSALVFESDSGVFSVTRWNTEFLTRPISDFPSGDCLQVWGVNEELQAKPSTCNTRHSWVAVAPDVQFWRNTSQLRVRYGAELIGTCDLRAGKCSVNFP